MIREVLLALNGHTGDVVRRFEEKSVDGRPSVRFAVANDAPFVNEGQREVLDKICQLGALYASISGFVRVHDLNSPARARGRVREGVYLQAVSEAVCAELDEYRRALLGVESSVRGEPTESFSLIRLLYTLSDFFVLLPELDAFLQEVSQDGSVLYHGALVLDLLHKRSMHGQLLVSSMFKRVGRHCRGVMLYHISGWVLFGELNDPHEEFFIKSSTNRFMEPSNNNNGRSGSHVDQLLMQQQRVSEQFDFRLRLTQLPSAFISPKMAKKILFVGKAVRLLQVAKDCDSFDVYDAEEKREFVAFCEAQAGMGVDAADSDRFHGLAMEVAIDSLKDALNEKLWGAVVKQGGLMASLEVVRGFFLLGRGDFFLTFVHEARTIMARRPTTRSHKDINNGPFKYALAKSGLEDDPSVRNLCMSISLPSFDYRKLQFATQHMAKTSADGVSVAGVGLVLTCDAELKHRTIRLTAPASLAHAQTGAVWQHPKHTVINGFNCRIVLKSTSSSASSSSAPPLAACESSNFSFVVQNSNAQLAPAMAITTAARSSSSARSSGGEAKNNQFQSVHRSMENSFRVEFQRTAQGGCVIAAFVEAPAERKDSDGAFGPSPMKQRQKEQQEMETKQQTEVVCLGGAEMDSDLFDGEEHTAVVEVSIHPHVLRVFLLPRKVPVLELPMASMARSLRLDSGAAWIGVASGRADASAAAMSLVAWSFTEFVETHAPAISTPSSISKHQNRLFPALSPSSSSASQFDFASPPSSSYSPSSSSSSLSGVDCWAHIQLSYTFESPLHLMIPRDAPDQLNSLFRLLLGIKRVRVGLQEVWQRNGRESRRSKHKSDLIALQICRCRSFMLFFVRNVEHYMYNCVDVGYQQLLRTIQESQQFDSVSQSIDKFTNQLLLHCLLRDGVLMRSLRKILDVCLRFCATAMTSSERTRVEAASPGQMLSWKRELKQIEEEFYRQASFFFTVISRGSSLRLSPQLANLAMQLEFFK